MFVSHELAAAAIILFLLLLLLGGILMGVVFYGAGYDCGLRDGLNMNDLRVPKRDRNVKMVPHNKFLKSKGESYDRISDKMV